MLFTADYYYWDCLKQLKTFKDTKSSDKKRDEAGYNSILLHWVAEDRMGVSTTGRSANCKLDGTE